MIALITGGNSAADVAAQTAIAAEASLEAASESVALRHGFWLLAQIVLAARSDDFSAALHKAGLVVTNDPNLIEIGVAMMTSIDRVGRLALKPDDFTELACKTASQSLLAVAGRSTATLFGTSYEAEEAKSTLRALSTSKPFAVLARDFIGRLTRSFLNYFLSRTLAEHVGVDKRFQTFKDHHAFTEAISLHCHEASVIVEAFAADWHTKSNFEGGITQVKAGGFIHHALWKMRTELERRRDVVHA